MRIIEELLGGFLLVLMYIWESVSTLFKTIIKFPMRRKCKKVGHDWLYHGNCFMGMFGPKYPFTCHRCGKISTGKMDDLGDEPITARMK